MKIDITRRSLLAGGALALGGLARAENRIIKIVVPFPPGGVTDLAGRLVAEHLGRQLGQTVIVENRPGAGGRLGVEAVMKAPKDGTTLLFTNPSYSILPVVERQPPWNPLTDLQPIAVVDSYGLGIVVGSNSPARTLPELIAYARKNPGKLSYGSSGPGSGAHFAGEYFKALTGTSLVHVPYRSTYAAATDVAAGVLDLAFDAGAKPFIDGGKVRLLAVTDAKRDPRFPDVPTTAQAGLPDFTLSSWLGLFAPLGTAPATLERLNNAAQQSIADAAMQKRMHELGLLPESGPPERLAQILRNDLTLYRKIATTAQLKFD